MTEPQPAIVVQDLHKRYGQVYAVRGISFTVYQGEIFSLLGPNGAGKTTTISMLSCLLSPTQGDAFVLGHSIIHEAQAVKRVIGVVPQDVALYPDLSAKENLLFWGRMYGLRGKNLRKRVDEILELIGLQERQKDRVAKFSGGMKRRLNIGIALLHHPPVIYMDEPTLGVDPQSRRNILDGIKKLRDEGTSILYTTHYMEEAQEISDHIAIMDQGKIIAYGTHDELVRIVGEQDRIRLSLEDKQDQFLDFCRKLPGVEKLLSAEGGAIILLVTDGNRLLPQLFETANQLGIRISSVEIQEPNLESVFLHLTGHALRD
ncbi:MAG: ATP-binding cassette domain-containing protein [Anaerolineae bacterium]|nr:ATP-binding cassette domain-containing protein [Anaerolineae bacterium]